MPSAGPAPGCGAGWPAVSLLRALAALNPRPAGADSTALAAAGPPSSFVRSPRSSRPRLPDGRSLPPPTPRGEETGTPAGRSAGVPEGSEGAFALVRRAQDGDGEAFGELYDHYVDLVYRYIYYRVGSHPLAEDLTSETFLRALRRITSFSWQGRDFGAWLVTIARNLVADHYKSGRYRLEVQVADMLDADQAEDGPEDEVLQALTNAALLEAVKRLNPEQQECIVLRFLQGRSVSETAAAMGKNDGAIKALQYRAVRTLGRLLPPGLGPS